MATPSLIPTDADRDHPVRIHRVTRTNRHLWYQLTVLQQPERARACGAGTKDSDRRPVDPPPVVELRIKEGNSFEEGKEITFDYNANFFLYASLEQSRRIAPGRMQGQPNPPILTGSPVSGMAYLDRPAAAGYFIFPDLSVRHEGHYRLSFSLFETTKDEKDLDIERASDDRLDTGADWRMEIKTSPFDVFSAKKFPGLMESTPLSKEVADQGCHVRIRRDVRMRKRDAKSNNGRDRREDDMARRRTVTPASEDPHSAAARARSMSNSSEHRVPGPPEPPGHPSAVDPAGRGHLSFGGPQYASPHQYGLQSRLPPPSPGGPYNPATQYIKPEHQSYRYPPSRDMSQTGPSPAPRQDGHDRRQSGPYVPPSPSVYSNDGRSRPESHPSYPSTPVSSHPANLPSDPSLVLPRIKSPSNSVSPSNSSLKITDLLVQPLPSSEPKLEVGSAPCPPPKTPIGSKRKHDQTFVQNDRALRNHQRQLDPHYNPVARPCSPVGEQYKRADGTYMYAKFSVFTM
uniref:Developmental and secondary metabolism regulator veA n=1 Tax=Hapsidospora chrysogenum (strain ATCC 11550 / CBS 779.69 / DSM 880 / IAM 14645 / JCM 23072 / IMI 49137) TaxID=857340 RepID=VEA_HAPC1|nr:RecName: Full=Developmental and secondary metabolism regulator veA; AltName: Full=Velvet complex subunit A [Hapsidospora chrysogena]CAL68582.1 velvetA [Hapsidospora chrysogena]